LKIQFFVIKNCVGTWQIYFYKTIYDIAMGNAKVSNLNIIQRFQNKTLRKITNFPPHVSNHTLHKELYAWKHFRKRQKIIINDSTYTPYLLSSHPNELIQNLAALTIPGNPPRHFKRKWCGDLLNPYSK